jgi:hypothetical protein
MRVVILSCVISGYLLIAGDVRGQQQPADEVKVDVRGENPFICRDSEQRKNLLSKYGGSEESEAAVAAALKWIAEHQSDDGSWSFDHQLGPCQGRCDHQGSLVEGRNAATAMALLPLLGAGQTHMDGTYQKNIAAGLAYLLKQGNPKNGGLSFEEPGGSMYSHGLCSIVLCEAYAMTRDKELREPAQNAINYIAYAQDPVGGGWRYMPRQPGDASVFGWQMAAIKTGHLAYLSVPAKTLGGAIKFLDAVQSEEGSKYGYTTPGAGRATTAVGLLWRMHIGWPHDHPPLARGVEFLSEASFPSKSNMYYNYYATQVLFHYGGEPWDKWNTATRDWLLEKQSRAGHSSGSWHIAGDHGAERGGRLYCTSLATMMLEVYYRHKPIEVYYRHKPIFEK